MSSIMEGIADDLAQEVIAAAQELGDDNLITEIARVIGASSTTLQEAFMTAIRVRLSEQRARKALEERIAKGPAAGPKKEIGAGKILDLPEAGGGH